MKKTLMQQANHALHSITRFGESRHLAKQEGIAEKYIYSTASLNKYKSSLAPALDFISKEFGITRINDIKPKMIRAFIEKRQLEGAAVKTLKGYVTAFHKLEHAAPVAFGSSPRRFVPRDLELGTYMPGTTGVTKAFPQQELSKMIEQAYFKNFKQGLAIETMAKLGLRSREMAMLRVESIKLNGLSQMDLKQLKTLCSNAEDLKIYQAAGKGPCVFLRPQDGPKGGRARVVPIPADLVPKFEQLIREKSGSEPAFGAAQRTIQSWVAKAQERAGSAVQEGKGCHGLRKSYAREFMNSYLIKNGSENVDGALRELTAFMGHSRTEILRYYL